MKTPQLRLHKRNIWYARYWLNGKDCFEYFTGDKAESEKLYMAWLAKWTTLKASDPDRRQRSLRVVQVAEQWLSHIMVTRGKRRMQQYRSYTAHFVHMTGELPASRIELQHLEALAADLKGLDYSQRAVNAYTKAAKRMLVWAGRRNLIDKPDLDDLRLDRAPRPAPKYMSPEGVRGYLQTARKHSRALADAMALIYLTCARPGEVHRMIRFARGEPSSPIDRFITIDREKHPIAFETSSKTQHSTGSTRIIPLSAEALDYLDRARMPWSLDRFLELARDATTQEPPLSLPHSPLPTGRPKNAPSSSPRGAKILRSWGASELRRQGIPRADIERVLGHGSTEPIDHYVDESLVYLRSLVSRLTVRPGDARSAGRVRKKKRS